MKNNVKHNYGFTLLELMIVILILGFLISSIMISLFTSQQRGRDAQRKSDLKQLALAIEMFEYDYEQYPIDNDAGQLVACGSDASQVCDWGSTWYNTNTGVVYMATLPDDPSESTTYYYVSNGTYYLVFARLENQKDKDYPMNGDTPQSYTNTDCGEDVYNIQCNYLVKSASVTPENLTAWGYVLEDE